MLFEKCHLTLIFTLYYLLFPLTLCIYAVEPTPNSSNKNQFFLHGYGTINYQTFNWQTDPTRRAQMDLERLAIEPTYILTNKIRFEAEIEFEHGGTGATMEFDKLEEFGEYESEVEKGGEVTLEELCIVFSLHPNFNIRLGHFFLPIGWAYTLDEPVDYFTVQRSEMESQLIPLLWHETGIEIFGELGALFYQVQVINGLDATGFSSSTWISRGHQGRFETVNAENLALAGRLDCDLFPQSTFGIAGYYGNSAGNRPKPDLPIPAYVTVLDMHADYKQGPFKARALLLYGILQNAASVSLANKNLSSNLAVKRTPVGKTALGWFAEVGVDVFVLLRTKMELQNTFPKQSLDIFARCDRYDTMREMPEEYFNNPRWGKETWTTGVNYKPHPQVILKGQLSYRTLGLATNNQENTYSLGLGLVF